MNNAFALLCITGTMLLCGASSASAQQLTSDEALELAAARSPALQSLRIQARQQKLATIREANRYVPLFNAETGAGLDQRLDVLPDEDGEVGLRRRQTLSLDALAGMSYQSAWGATMSASLSMSNTSSVVSNLDGSEPNTFDAINTRAAFVIAQPLLRGFGPTVGRAGLEDAKLSRQVVRARASAQAMELGREVLTAYWSLWYTERELEISQQALKLARRSRDEAQTRVDAGLLADSDLIALETEIATAEERILLAKIARRNEAITLARLLGASPDEVATAQRSPDIGPTPNLSGTQELAREKSPELTRVRHELDRAVLAAVVARDAAKPNLQARATVGVNGFGETPGQSLLVLGSLSNLLAGVSLSFDIPVQRRGLEAEAERIELGVTRLESELQLAQERIDESVARFVNELDSAAQRKRLAERTAGLAGRTVEVTRSRFEVGRATTLDVVQTLQRQREARLRATRAAVDWALTRIALDALTGTLTL